MYIPGATILMRQSYITVTALNQARVNCVLVRATKLHPSKKIFCGEKSTVAIKSGKKLE